MDTGWYSCRNSRTTVQCGTGTVNASQCRVPPPRVRRLRCPVAATPPHLKGALTRQAILRLYGRMLTASRKSLLRNAPSCCCVTGCRASRRDFAPAAHPAAANAGHPPNSPCSVSSDSSLPSLGASVSLPSLGRCWGSSGCRALCLGTCAWVAWRDQAHVVARSTVSTPLAAPQDGELPADDASDASDASAATVNSSNCDPQSPDEIPVISPPDLAAVLAAQDVTDVLAEVTAPLVTISIEERRWRQRHPWKPSGTARHASFEFCTFLISITTPISANSFTRRRFEVDLSRVEGRS